MKHIPIPSDARPLKGNGHSVIIDPFDGLFTHGRPALEPESLMNQPQARRLFDLIARVQAEDLYPFQQPLAGASGRHIQRDGQSLLMLSAYDYLGLIGHPRLTEAAIEAVERYGTGTGGVRLLTGTAQIHVELETCLAATLGTRAALTFNSGFMANVGIIDALFGPGDEAILDAHVHHSVVAGCRLAGVRIRRFRHNDVDHLDHLLGEAKSVRRTLVAVDGVYSMDGDLCPLPELLRVVRRRGASLLVDEAHSLGSVGPGGRGAVAHFGIDANEIDVITGSLSKAIASSGGFVAGSRPLIAFLQHAAGPYVFSGALSPASAGAAMAAIGVIQCEPWRLKRLQRNAARLCSGLKSLGFDTGVSTTAIVPVITGTDERAFQLSRFLLNQGVIATPVVAPAVPNGQARLRLCATAAHEDSDIDAALAAFRAHTSAPEAMPRPSPSKPKPVPESRVFTSLTDIAPPLWDSLLEPGDLLATHRFVSACERARIEGAMMRHVHVQHCGRTTGIASLFRCEVQLDLLATGPTRRALNLLDRFHPGALRLPMLFCGVPVSFGSSCLRVAPDAAPHEVLACILAAMEQFAAETETGLLCVKELDERMNSEFGPILRAHGFMHAASLPGCHMALPWKQAEDWHLALRSGYRRQLALDRRAGASARLERQVTRGLGMSAAKAHALYVNVIARAPFRMEVLPKAFFEELEAWDAAELSSITLRREGNAIAHAILLGTAPRCHFLLAGLDYNRLAPGHAYQNLVADVIEAAIAVGASSAELGQTSYALKTRLGATTTPRHIWLRHRGPLQHRALATVLPHLFPATSVAPRHVFHQHSGIISSGGTSA